MECQLHVCIDVHVLQVNCLDINYHSGLANFSYLRRVSTRSRLFGFHQEFASLSSASLQKYMPGALKDAAK